MVGPGWVCYYRVAYLTLVKEASKLIINIVLWLGEGGRGGGGDFKGLRSKIGWDVEVCVCVCVCGVGGGGALYRNTPVTINNCEY